MCSVLKANWFYPSFVTLGVRDWALAKRGVSLAFLNLGLRLNTKFVARMLRPYKNHNSDPEMTKEGLYQFYVKMRLITRY